MSAEPAVKYVTETPKKKSGSDWINTEEYKEKNFARQALVINPAHACQPLGAELVAHGFEGTLPFVHGSQGCASYYRSTLNRHFREPAPAVSDAMTEDGAVFGGQNNLHEGLENAIALYKPKMMAVFTSCMPEVIGDDLTAFIKNARQKGFIPKDLPVPYANTPSFNGSHIHGYDAMLLSILQTLTEGKKVEGRCTGKLNLIPGFDANTGNYREYKRILDDFGIPYTILADISETFDSPCDGTYQHLSRAEPSSTRPPTRSTARPPSPSAPTRPRRPSPGSRTTTPASMLACRCRWGSPRPMHFLMKIAELFGKDGAGVAEGRAGPGRGRHDRRPAVHARQEVRGLRRPRLPDGLRLLPAGDGRHARTTSSAARAARRSRRSSRRCSTPRPTARVCTIYMNKDLWHLRCCS